MMVVVFFTSFVAHKYGLYNVRSVPGITLLHTPTPVLNCNGQHRSYDKKNQVCLSILSFLGFISCDIMSCFWFLDVFGTCCIHISVEPYQSSFGSGQRPTISGAARFRCQCSHFFKWTNCTRVYFNWAKFAKCRHGKLCLN